MLAYIFYATFFASVIHHAVTYFFCAWIDIMIAVRCSTNGKHKGGGLRIMIKLWNFTMYKGLTIKVFLSPLLQSLKMRAPRRIAQ